MKYPFALDFALQEHLRNKPESLSGCDTVACDDPRALEAFDCYLEAFSKDSDTTRREIGKIKYVDLNNDGYLDILFESIEDILDPNVRVDIFDRNERDSAKSIGDKSKRAERYIWNKKSLIFEKSP